MKRQWAIFGALSMILGMGCGSPEVEYVLVFPSLETYLLSANARIDVYDGSEDPDSICRSLSVNQVPDGAEPLQSTGKQDVCAFDSGIQLDNVDTGRLVFFAEAEDQSGTALLRGCRVADVYPDSTEVIEVVLATLPTYPESPNVSCVSKEDKCEEKISCVGN